MKPLNPDTVIALMKKYSFNRGIAKGIIAQHKHCGIEMMIDLGVEF